MLLSYVSENYTLSSATLQLEERNYIC